MRELFSRLIAAWWQYKGRRKQALGRRQGNDALLIEGKRDELAGMIKARSGCSIRQAVQEADENNV